MDPIKYREFLKNIELNTIILDSCTIKTNRNKISSNMKLDIQHKVDYTIEEKNSAVILSSYDLVATKSTKKEFALKVACVYRVLFSSKQPITEEFMEIYSRADIIISKGQGNFEGLMHENHDHLFFLLMVKCDVIAKKLGVNKHDIIIMQGT